MNIDVLANEEKKVIQILLDSYCYGDSIMMPMDLKHVAFELLKKVQSK